MENNTERTRINIKTHTSGRVQLDITAEYADPIVAGINLNTAIMQAKQIIIDQGFKLIEEKK